MKNFLIQETLLIDHMNRSNIDLNIALAIDENYITPSGVLIFSILQNNENLNIHFHIFTTSKDLDKFNHFLDFKTKITLYILNESYFSSLQTPGHFSSAIYYRIAIPTILFEKIDKILYVDADILCVNNLKELSSVDITHFYLAAVEDLEMKQSDKLSLGITEKYFNSGVMLINIEKWIKEDIFTQFMELVNKNVYKYPDQDALNILFKNNVYYLSSKYNHFTEKDSNNANLIHYVGALKPWSMASENNEMYLQYYNSSPFKNIALQIPNTHKIAKKLSKKYLKNKRYSKAIQWYFIYIIMKIKK